MLTILSKNWWLLALRGVFAILFGVLTILFPGIALSTLIILFAVYAIADGLVAVWSAIQHRDQEQWWVHLLEGLVSVLAGIGAVAFPGLTALTLLYLIAAWAIITGIFEILAAIRLRKEIEGEFWMGLSGLLSILFGVFLFVSPGAGALSVLTIIAIYAIAFGLFLIMLAFRVRGMSGSSSTSSPRLA
jgi:uncharacterized membrane protein HdeD (DUF308 family)